MARHCDLAVGGPRCVGGDTAYSQHFFPYYFVMSSVGSNMIFFCITFLISEPHGQIGPACFFVF